MNAQYLNNKSYRDVLKKDNNIKLVMVTYFIYYCEALKHNTYFKIEKRVNSKIHCIYHTGNINEALKVYNECIKE